MDSSPSSRTPFAEEIKWSTADDRKLIILVIGRFIQEHEYPVIAASFSRKDVLRVPRRDQID